MQNIMQSLSNGGFLESIDTISGTVGSGASKFSTFDKNDFVNGSHTPCNGDTVMKGIAGSSQIKGRGTVKCKMADHHGVT